MISAAPGKLSVAASAPPRIASFGPSQQYAMLHAPALVVAALADSREPRHPMAHQDQIHRHRASA